LVKVSLQDRGFVRDPGEVERALERLFTNPEQRCRRVSSQQHLSSTCWAFRRAEFNIIRSEVNDNNRGPNLRVIPTDVPDDLSPWIARVNLVERLRETRVLYGFDRLEPDPQPLAGLPDTAIRQLFRDQPNQPQDRWLPAIEVFGENV
jgi:hypothetical protein